MLFKVPSKKPLAQVGKDLEAAAQANKFGVLAVHDLAAKLREKGLDLGSECLVYEVCNPLQAKKVLEVSPQISAALPCRIAVYPEGDGVVLATMRPSALIGMFGVPALAAVAAEVEGSMITIMEQAAR